MRAGMLMVRAVAIALTLAATAAAQGEPGSGSAAGLTFDAALQIARERNPDIRAADARFLSMRERPIQARTLPDPSVGIRYHNEDWKPTFGDSEFTYFEVSAEQPIPFPGKLPLRGRIADREAEREGAMRDLTVLMVLANVAGSYADLAATEQSEAILRESATILDLMIQETAARYRVGDAAQQDVLRATQERSVLEERLTMLVRKRAVAAAALKALLDIDGAEALPPTAPLPVPPPLDPLDALLGKLDAASPELRAAREDLLRSQEALRLAHREYLPDFSVMGAYTNKDRLLPEWEVGLRVSVPLYFWRKQRAGVAEASFAERAAKHTQRNTQLSLEARLSDAHAMAEASQRLIRLYGDTLVPQATLTLESARSSYGVGRVDFLSTLNAFSALLEYRLRYAEETGNLVRARAEIGPLVGETPLGEPLASGP